MTTSKKVMAILKMRVMLPKATAKDYRLFHKAFTNFKGNLAKV